MKRGTFKHPKTDDLACRLGIPFSWAGGLLGALWEWAAEYAPAGNVGKYSNQVIAKNIGFPSERADELVQALTDAGFLDVHPGHRAIIHDWADHCEDSVHARLARSIQLFADGSIPNMKKLGLKERESVLAAYTAANGGQRQPEIADGRLPPSPPPPPSPSCSPPPPIASCAAEAASGGDEPEPETTKTEKPKRAKQPTDPELLEWIDAWNALPTHIRGPTCNRDPPAKVVLRAWERRCRDSELRRIADDKTRVIEAVSTAAYCHGKPWFTFAWLFATGQTGEWNCEKLLNGAYRENRSRSVKTQGDGRIAADSGTFSKIKYFTPPKAAGTPEADGAEACAEKS